MSILVLLGVYMCYVIIRLGLSTTGEFTSSRVCLSPSRSYLAIACNDLTGILNHSTMVECPVCPLSFGDMLVGDGAAMHDLMTHKLAEQDSFRISVARHKSNHTKSCFSSMTLSRYCLKLLAVHDQITHRWFSWSKIFIKRC